MLEGGGCGMGGGGAGGTGSDGLKPGGNGVGWVTWPAEVDNGQTRRSSSHMAMEVCGGVMTVGGFTRERQ